MNAIKIYRDVHTFAQTVWEASIAHAELATNWTQMGKYAKVSGQLFVYK